MKFLSLVSVLNLTFLVSTYSLSVEPIKYKELYDKSLIRLNSVDQLLTYIDSCAKESKVNAPSKEYVFLVNNVIQRRFYHTYCHYSLGDNPIAYLAGRYIWDHLSAIVISDDILKHEMAACSQQSIVMMKVLKEKGYLVRKLGLKGHFMLEVYFNNAWRVFDPDKEIRTPGFPHDSLNTYLANGYLTKAYAGIESPETIIEMFSSQEVGEPNVHPAEKAKAFHKLTKFFFYVAMAISFVSIVIVAFFLIKFSTRKSIKLSMS